MPRATRPYEGDADLRFFSPQPDTSLHCKTTDTEAIYVVHRAVYLLTPPAAFAGTHFIYPGRDGQAELTRMTGYRSL